MDIALLRTFMEVKSTRHFGKAAENLYLTQAAVSARIKQLESVIGAPLFARYRNNLQLTATGERLVSHAETIILAWERARQDVALKQEQKRSITLGATTGLWDLILQDALHEMHKLSPSLAIRAESHGQEILIRQLMERTLDFALLYEPTKNSDLVSTSVAPAELILVCNDPNASIDTALAHNYVSVDWGLSFKSSFAQLFPGTPPPILHTSLARIALDFIKAFGGCAYLPYRLVEQDLGQFLFQVLEAPVIVRQIYATYHRDSVCSKEIDELLSVICSLQEPAKTILSAIEI